MPEAFASSTASGFASVSGAAGSFPEAFASSTASAFPSVAGGWDGSVSAGSLAAAGAAGTSASNSWETERFFQATDARLPLQERGDG